MKRLEMLLSVLLVVFVISVSAQANPLPPLVDQGDTVYDAVSKISWVKNANLGGPMTWDEANTWAAGLNINGLTGWRQPTLDEMQNLYNQGVTYKTPGLFTDLRALLYWTGTEYAPNPDNAWEFNFYLGSQHYYSKYNKLYAMAVRP